MAVLSAGYGNRFGHPHPKVVERITRSGGAIYSTAEGGALRFDFVAGEAPGVNLYRKVYRRFWM